MKNTLMTLTALLMGFSTQAAEPQYPIIPVSAVCDAALNRDNYSEDMAKAAFPLTMDKDGWMTGGSREFSAAFMASDLNNLKRFVKALKSRGTEHIYLALVPPRTLEHNKFRHGQYTSYGALKEAYLGQLKRLEKIGFITSDLSEGMQNIEPAFYFKRDAHWHPEGAKLTAQNITQALEKRGALKGIPDHTVETSVIGQNVKSADFFNRTMQQLCGYKLPTEYSPAYETTPEVDIDIFGENVVPEISLIGTSFSANEKYHFGGFLRTAMKKDTLNQSLKGGGEYGAWFNYLYSRTESDDAPRVVIWEMPSYSNPAQYNDLRQVIPLVNNGCQAGTSLVTFSEKVPSGGKNELVFDPALFGFHASQLVMDIQVDDPKASSLSFRVWFESGFHYDFTVDLINPETANGRFVFELSDKSWDYRGKVLAIDLLPLATPSSPASIGVTGNICLNEFR